MLIILKNKDTLICDDFRFKCSTGKKGISSQKKEFKHVLERKRAEYHQSFYRTYHRVCRYLSTPFTRFEKSFEKSKRERECAKEESSRKTSRRKRKKKRREVK